MPRNNSFQLAVEILDTRKVGEWVRIGNRTTVCNESPVYAGAPTIHGRICHELLRDQPEEFEMSGNSRMQFIRRRPAGGLRA